MMKYLFLILIFFAMNAYAYNDYLISVPVADTPVFEEGEQPLSYRLGQVYNDGSGDRQVIYQHSDEQPTYTNMRLVGAWGPDGLPLPIAWDNDGNVTERVAVHPDYLVIRPLANIDGKATGPLDLPKWQGTPDRNLAVDDTDPENIVVYKYPTDHSPFTIRLEHIHVDGTWPGWGWQATMVSDDPARDITARAIGVYTDADCTQYQYTTGAFVNTDGVYQTKTPLGFYINQADRPTWHLALLLGAGQEGCVELPPGVDSVEMNFWAE